ncbi:hypothetical protein V2J09_022446 [Rumex salicifolius]
MAELMKSLDSTNQIDDSPEVCMGGCSSSPPLSSASGQDCENDIVAESAAFVPEDGSGPPYVNSEAETIHEKVSKKIIKEGLGEKPSKYSTCFVHYRAWTESTQHKFEDTWQEQRPVELVLGKEKTELTGLGIGVSSMKSGERALLHVGWELAYGKEGSFSFPNVPPMVDVIYEVDLIGFDEAKEGKTRSDMTVEERIGAADRRRMNGNALFKEEKLEEALQQYEMVASALAYMGDDFMFQLFGRYRDMAMAVQNPCHLNMAACMIKLMRYEDAIMHCGIVLAEDGNNVKALYRRGKARAELGQTEPARQDLQKARKLAPGDKAISKELRLLAEDDKAVYQKQKEIYKGLFGPRPEPKPQRANWLIIIWQFLLSLFYRLFKHPVIKND